MVHHVAGADERDHGAEVDRTAADSPRVCRVDPVANVKPDAGRRRFNAVLGLPDGQRGTHDDRGHVEALVCIVVDDVDVGVHGEVVET